MSLDLNSDPEDQFFDASEEHQNRGPNLQNSGPEKRFMQKNHGQQHEAEPTDAPSTPIECILPQEISRELRELENLHIEKETMLRLLEKGTNQTGSFHFPIKRNDQSPKGLFEGGKFKALEDGIEVKSTEHLGVHHLSLVPDIVSNVPLDLQTQGGSLLRDASVSWATRTLGRDSKIVQASRSTTLNSKLNGSHAGLELRDIANGGQFVVKPEDDYNLCGSSIRNTKSLSAVLTNSPPGIGFSNEAPLKMTTMPSSHHGFTRQLNMFLKTKSDSGKKLSDKEILMQVPVKNLDTGEQMDLAEAEAKLLKAINPLSLHIMRLTSEFVNPEDSKSDHHSDRDSVISSEVVGESKLKANKIGGIKKLLSSAMRKNGSKSKSLDCAEANPHQVSEMDGNANKKLGKLATDIASADGTTEGLKDGKSLPIFKRIQSHKSSPDDFKDIKFAQEISAPHLGPIWCMKFSHCGQLLATAGQDTVLRVWVLKRSYSHFKELCSRYNTDIKQSPTNSYENVIDEQIANDTNSLQVFVNSPFCSYTGHTSDLLDISWSKNYFILTSSMDKTVCLWHLSRKEGLCCFKHIDFVTAIEFHPKNDQFFLSVSLDGKLRLWNIPEKKVVLWNEVDGPSKLITAANFIQNGKFAVVGTYDGRCIFYSTDQLKYYTMIHVRSSRGKNKKGRKVTGIEEMPGEDKILVTSNDNRIRVYDLRDLSLVCKYKGYTNTSSQIRANFSPDGRYIIAGSENQCVYLWRTNGDGAGRRDKNGFYEAIKAHNAVVTCASFSPSPSKILSQLKFPDDKFDQAASMNDGQSINTPFGYVFVSGDYDANIKVFFCIHSKQATLPR